MRSQIRLHTSALKRSTRNDNFCFFVSISFSVYKVRKTISNFDDWLQDWLAGRRGRPVILLHLETSVKLINIGVLLFFVQLVSETVRPSFVEKGYPGQWPMIDQTVGGKWFMVLGRNNFYSRQKPRVQRDEAIWRVSFRLKANKLFSPSWIIHVHRRRLP